MTFADGTRFELLTVGSNYLYGGGPWQAKISGTYYMQFGFDLLQGMFDIREALQLPPGETAAMTCGGFDDSPLNMAFPPVSE
jgi:hypothetical protein